MGHPTPAEIKAAIFKALADDYDVSMDNKFMPDIPSRAFTLVSRAIERACEEYDKEMKNDGS